MPKHRFSLSALAVMVIVFVLAMGLSTPVAALPPTGEPAGQMVPVTGNVPYLITSPQFQSALENLGPANGSTVLNVTLYLSLQNLPGLESLASMINTPGSGLQHYLFHHYLTPARFRQLFYPSVSEIEQIKAYYAAQGFTVWQDSYAPTVIMLKGNVTLIDQAFMVTEYQYQYLFNGKQPVTFITNNQNPSVPGPFHADILHIYGLSYSSDFLLNTAQAPPVKSDLIIQSAAADQAGNAVTLTPPNLENFYGVSTLLSHGYNGRGTTVGILGLGGVNMTTVDMFWREYGITPPTTHLVNLTANGQNPFPEGGEPDLDIEWSGAMAPGATFYDVQVPFNLTGIGDNAVNLELYYMLNVVNPNVVTGSWAELQFHHDPGFAAIYDQIGLQAAVQGVTIFLGSADSHSINYLTVMASSTIVSVGGVDPVLNATGVMTGEYAWYYPLGSWYGGPVGSGGGNSFFFPKPAYQVDESIVVPAVYTNRGQPDIAMPASHLIVAVHGGWHTGGGTSFATPISAGIFADIESALAAHSGTSVFGLGWLQSARLGWLQPALYDLGYGSAYGYPAYHMVSYLQPGSWLTGSGFLGYGWNEFVGIGSLSAYNLTLDLQAYNSQA